MFYILVERRVDTLMGNLPEHDKTQVAEPTNKGSFSYEIENSNSSIVEFKTLFNSIVKAIESDEDVSIEFELNIQDNINISQTKSTVSYMKTLVTTMLKLIEKDDMANDISYKLHIKSK